jgi:hypothetical protein
VDNAGYGGDSADTRSLLGDCDLIGTICNLEYKFFCLDFISFSNPRCCLMCNQD